MITQIKQPIFIALSLSLLLHGLFFLPLDSHELSQTAKGHNQLILLETSPIDKTIIKQQDENSATANQVTKQKLTSGNLHPQVEANQQAALITKQTAQLTQTSNQGDLLDQSGKELTAQQKYEHMIYQHLLKKMESAPYSGSGSANVALKIISAGIAINVEIDQTSGKAGYKSWLLQKILSSNPMPPFFSDMKERQIIMSISFKHETEN